MLDFGFSEILLTSAIALVVLGPERLPKVARQVGNWMGRARAMARQLSEQLEREVSAEELLREQTKSKAAPMSRLTSPSYVPPDPYALPPDGQMPGAATTTGATALSGVADPSSDPADVRSPPMSPALANSSAPIDVHSPPMNSAPPISAALSDPAADPHAAGAGHPAGHGPDSNAAHGSSSLTPPND
jgi:sec-independent protein translocase protein TatB